MFWAYPSSMQKLILSWSQFQEPAVSLHLSKRLHQDLHRALAEALTQVVEMDTASCAVHAPSVGETVEAGRWDSQEEHRIYDWHWLTSIDQMVCVTFALETTAANCVELNVFAAALIAVSGPSHP